MTRNYDVQGRFLGMPYDFRVPTLHKVLTRIYHPGGPILVPKIWGAGWTLNLANAGSWWLICTSLVATIIVLAVG